MSSRHDHIDAVKRRLAAMKEAMRNAERQAQYDRLLIHFVGTTDLPMEFRQSRACALLHDRIVNIIEGREVMET